MLVPTVNPNPRDEQYADDVQLGGAHRATYSGRLVFGSPAQRGSTMSRMDFTGVLWLPDSLAYRAERIGNIRVVADFWVQSMSEYLFAPATSAQLAVDTRQPDIAFVQLAVTVQGYSGAIVGYRATVTAPRDAIVAA